MKSFNKAAFTVLSLIKKGVDETAFGNCLLTGLNLTDHQNVFFFIIINHSRNETDFRDLS